jgi:hypothetical protein
MAYAIKAPLLIETLGTRGQYKTIARLPFFYGYRKM